LIFRKHLKGGFYLPHLNPSLTNFFTSNNSNPVFISTAINNSLQSIKSYYWLYKYNLLHRSTFKNSHNLTIVKKLLTTGFYDTTITTNNLWAAGEYLNAEKITNLSSTVPALKNLLYNNTNTLDHKVFLNENTLTSPTFLKKTSFYQKSFNWFLTRTYFFTGLKTSSLNSSYGLLNREMTEVNKNDLSAFLNLFINAGLQTSILSNQYYTGKLNYPDTLLKNIATPSSLNTNLLSNNIKDAYILDGSHSPFNLTDSRFLTFLFQSKSIGSKQIYYNQLPLNFHKIYKTNLLECSLHPATTSLNDNKFYPTNAVVEQTFTQDLALYLLLLNR
jgi:hypothetical protein